MEPYHKVQTVWLRDPNTKYKTLLRGEWALPEFAYLADSEWVWTEKVDGTNIRVMFDHGNILFGGRTDNAQLPAPLVQRLQDRFFGSELISEMFPCGACLYGEGYGAKIQKGGGNYRPDQDFVLFDVRVGEWWLQRKDVKEVASKMGLDIVPIIGCGTLHEMIDHTAAAFQSTWGEFDAEGVVARPATELRTRCGHRIITKIKLKDFEDT